MVLCSQVKAGQIVILSDDCHELITEFKIQVRCSYGGGGGVSRRTSLSWLRHCY